ncbi:DUF3558 family protein [Saccharopolyspora gloriosae]|uniref:Flagellar basal body L-ring protein FlgH n=1 Tax=Saccharopolyspora gloriosae TaxID=455344 RepID=A0A840NKL5_9PSEU|nr:flagellar basal body L-ring protein FlgH [Saccharopolyspora gloriosae]
MLTASLLMLTAISSCAVGGEGEQQPPQAAPSTENIDPALAVENPKNLKGVADACQLLTPEQRTALQVDGAPEQADSLYKEPACSMEGDMLTARIEINSNQGGMTATHERKDNFDNFEPTEVAGYPAALVNFSDSLCSVIVGVSDTQSVDVYYAMNSGGAPEMNDGCGYAKKIAAEVVQNIPAA